MKKFKKEVEERACDFATIQFSAIIITGMIKSLNIEFLFVNLMYLPILFYMGFYDRINKGENTALKLIAIHGIIYTCVGLPGLIVSSNEVLFQPFIAIMTYAIFNGICLFLLVLLNLWILNILELRHSRKSEA